MTAKTHFGKFASFCCDSPGCDQSLTIRNEDKALEDLTHLARMMGWTITGTDQHYCDQHQAPDVPVIRVGKKRSITAKSRTARTRAVDAGHSQP